MAKIKFKHKEHNIIKRIMHSKTTLYYIILIEAITLVIFAIYNYNN